MGQGPVSRRSGLAGVTKIAILDDYIGVALEYGDWTVLPDDAEITVYRQAIPPERLVDELSDYEIVVITQQRCQWPTRSRLSGKSDYCWQMQLELRTEGEEAGEAGML